MVEPPRSFSIEELSVAYGAHRVLERVNMQRVSPGSVVAVLGPNGVGKSTLIRALARLIPGEGCVKLGETELLRCSRRDHLDQVAYLPQLLPQPAALLVYEAVRAALRAIRPDLSQADCEMRLWPVFDKLQLRELAMRSLDRLSGGQRQMVGLAQVLVRNAPLMLLDEPTSALDLRWQLLALSAVRQAVDASRGVALVSLHDINLALRFADRVFVLGSGQVLADGDPACIDSSLLRRAYGVEARCERAANGDRVILADHCA